MVRYLTESRLSIFILTVLSLSLAQAQVQINEVVHTNVDQILDEDGDDPDWFELYNTSSGTVDLGGYRITDNNDPDKWIFPNIGLPAGGRLVVFASGKDRNTITADHWETAIVESDDYTYFEGYSEPPANWNTSAVDVSGWATGNGGFGFGDGDDATLLGPDLVSFYVRRNFTVVDRTKLSSCLLSVDYDDGFVAYLNGVEIARRNIIGATDHTTLAASDREAQVYAGGDYETITVDQAVLAGALVNGANVFAVEVHNATVGSSDMSLRTFLHFGISVPTTFYAPLSPVVIVPAASLLHTNFKLGTGETLMLRNPTGILVSSVLIPDDLQPGNARARIPDGGVLCYTSTPTPGQPNQGPCVTAYASLPQFSIASGFYPSQQTVSITGNTVRYTTDGSVPTTSSPLYSVPFTVDTTLVVHARSFEAGKLPSTTANGNFFVNQPTTLPVVSITADPAVLFGDSGVYDAVPIGGGLPRVLCNVQYYDADKTLAFQNPAGFQVIGNYSLLFPQKGMEFSCKDRFGSPETMQHVIFPQDKPGIDKFNDFRIKNADNENTRMRDLVANRMAIPTNNVTVGFGNVAGYINGRYWGHFNSRERMDENFFKRNFNVDPDSVDIIKSVSFTPEFYDASNGTTDDFFAMSDFIINNDMADPLQYAAASELIDVENWIDFYATRIYLADYDWMWEFQNNTMLFKSHSPLIKWRYVLWDCANSQNYSDLTRPWSDYMLRTFFEGEESRHKWMINSLMLNNTFHDLFINRFADLMNYYYTTEKVFPIIDSNLAEILPEMDAHNARWATGDAGSIEFGTTYELKAFHEERPPFQRDHIESYFGLDGQVELTLQAQPAGWGRIQISTITPTTDELPWTGIYFHGVPVSVTAIPEPGYAFVDWDDSPNILDTLAVSFSRDFDANTVLTANFRATSVGVAEQELNTIRLFPNPTTGIVRLETDRLVRYAVRDMIGRTLLADATPRMLSTIDLSGLPDGLYTITLDVDGDRETQRIEKLTLR